MYHSVSVCESTLGLSRDGFTPRGLRNRINQKLVEKIVRTHTNLVLRESLDDILRHLLPWDIPYDLVIDDPVVGTRSGTRSVSVDCVTHAYLVC